jgi:tetratricopeptide (TPR) repeat protein
MAIRNLVILLVSLLVTAATEIHSASRSPQRSGGATSALDAVPSPQQRNAAAAAEAVAAKNGRDSWEHANALINLAKIQIPSARPLDAEPTLREAERILRRLPNTNDQRVQLALAEVRQYIGQSFAVRGELAEAIRLQSDASKLIAQLKPDSETLGNSYQMLALLRVQVGEATEAERLFNDALSIHRKNKNAQQAAEAQLFRALLLAAQGKRSEADDELRRAIDVLARTQAKALIVAKGLLARGIIAQANQQPDVATKFIQDALALQQRYEEAHPDIAETLFQLATLSKLSGNLSRAETLLRQAVQISERALGPRSLQTLLNQVRLANHLIAFSDVGSRDSRAEVADIVSRVQAVLEREQFPSNHPLRSEFLLLQARLAEREGRVEDGVTVARRALDLKRREAPRDDYGIASSMIDLGMLLLANENLAEAETLLTGAHDLFKVVLPPRHVDLVLSLVALGMLEHTKGEFARAQARFTEAASAMPPDQAIARRFGLLINAMSAISLAISDPEAAEPILKEARSRIAEILGSGHRADAEMARILGLVLASRGELIEAEQLLRHALTWFVSQFGPTHPDTVQTILGLGSLLQMKGDLAGAAALFTDTLRRIEQGAPSGAIYSASLVLGLADVYLAKREWGEAANHLSASADGIRRARGPDHFMLALVESRIGAAQWHQGDAAEALRHFDIAETVARRSLGDDSWLVGSILAGKALIASSGSPDDRARAVVFAKQAVTQIERTLGRISPETIAAHLVLAQAYWASGDLDGAQARFAEVATREAEAARHWLALNDETGYRSLLGQFSPLDVFVSFHMNGRTADAAAARLGFWSVLQRRGSLQDILAEHARLQHKIDDGAALFARWMQAERLARRCATPGLSSDFAGLPLNCSREAPRLLAEASAIREQLMARFPSLARPTAPVEFEPLARRLRDLGDFTLIEIVEYASYLPDAVDGDAKKYAAYILFPDGRIDWADLGEEQRITALASELRTLQSNASSDLAHVRRVARDLDSAVMQPLRAKLGGRKKVFVAADGQLGLIDFGSLIDQNGQPLVSIGYDIAGLTSGRDLLRLGDAVPAVGARADYLFLDPSYRATVDAPGSAAAKPSGVLGPLVKTCEQAFLREDWTAVSMSPALRARYESRFRPQNVLTRQDASKFRLMGIQTPRSVWLLTHGFFCEDAASGSATPTLWQNAMDRAAIVLAGGAAQQPDTRRNGYITAREMAALPWQDTELVVLGACDTASGVPAVGDGVHGLRRALATAGVRSQVMTLWTVEAAPTLDVLALFTERLSKGESRLTALRNAQRALIASKKDLHPYYWAGIYFAGDPRPMPLN